MRFARPDMLWLLLLLPALATLFVVVAARRRKALERFAGGTEQRLRFIGEVSSHRRAAKALLLLLALGAGVTAAARPQWGTRLEPVTRKGVDAVVLLDTSLSMAAEDAPPDRLGLAKRAAASIMSRLAGDRVALVTFSGKAVLVCPLTLDHEAARLFLDAVDFESAPVPGTALAEAVDTAIQAFGPAASGETRGRALLVLSDGEDHEGGVEAAVRRLRQASVTAFTLGIGTPQGAPIPVPDASHRSGEYKRDREGKLVTTRLDETAMTRLAMDTGGKYFRATPAEVEIDDIAKSVASMDASEAKTVLRARYEERYQIPLALAFLALLAETIVPERRTTSRREPPIAGGSA